MEWWQPRAKYDTIANDWSSLSKYYRQGKPFKSSTAVIIKRWRSVSRSQSRCVSPLSCSSGDLQHCSWLTATHTFACVFLVGIRCVWMCFYAFFVLSLCFHSCLCLTFYRLHASSHFANWSAIGNCIMLGSCWPPYIGAKWYSIELSLTVF